MWKGSRMFQILSVTSSAGTESEVVMGDKIQKASTDTVDW